MGELFDRLDDEARSRLRAADLPRFAEPMLATLVHDTFSDPEWIFERKLDGERCLAFCNGRGEVRLRSRSRQALNATYPELVEALGSEAQVPMALDGEIVAFDGAVTSFERLQRRIGITDPDKARRSGIAVTYHLFDLVHLDGCDTTALALRDRKRLLRDALSFEDPLRFTTHRNADGEAFFAEACRKGWEGLIAKDGRSRYVHKRSRSWLKLTCVNRQELVIGGFTDPEGSRQHFGALLVGYHDADGRLVYAGKVGTGFDEETLADLGRRMHERERRDTPFDRGQPPTRGVHWIHPELVGEIGFTEWTRAGRLRHPRFLGLRTDKPAAEVVRE